MDKDSKIFVAGHDGLVGRAFVRKLSAQGYNNVVVRSLHQLDLRKQRDVMLFFESERPEYVFLAAAKVGGILANSTYPASFIYDNLAIEINVLHAAYEYGVKKLLFLGSSCVYPKNAPQPIKEEYLLTSALEKTNEPYAIAKIAGLKMCEAYNRQYGTRYIAAMPTNLYGPHDNFDLSSSHVIPALIRKCVEAQRSGASDIVVWGTGTVYREFMYVDDCADAGLHLMHHYDGDEIVNIGTGQDSTITALVNLIQELTGFTGVARYDVSKPDGMFRKQLNVERMNQLGWHASTSLRDGLVKTIDWYIHNH